MIETLLLYLFAAGALLGGVLMLFARHPMRVALALIGAMLSLAGIYAMLVEGGRWYSWAEDHAPMGPKAVRRFAGAFVETGRGLAFGMVGAGVLQALLATAAYLVIGVPQAPRTCTL